MDKRLLKKKIPNNYIELLERLEEEKYIVELERDDRWLFWTIKGNRVQGGFCTPSENVSPHLNGKIAVDAKGIFDKWSKCPIILPIPETNRQLDYLIEQMKFLGTEEGFKASNEFDMYIYKYPQIK